MNNKLISIVGKNIGVYDYTLMEKTLKLAVHSTNKVLNPTIECGIAYILQKDFKNIKTPVYFNVTPKDMGKPYDSCPPVDLLVIKPSGYIIGFEIDGGSMHNGSIAKHGLANPAIVEEVVTRLSKKKESLGIDRMYLVLEGDASDFGGNANIKLLTKELAKHDITVIDLTLYSDKVMMNKGSSASRIFESAEKLRQFMQYGMNLTLTTKDSGYYKVTMNTIAQFFIDKYQYSHPYINVRSILANAPINSESEFIKYMKSNNLPFSLGFLLLGPRKVQKMQEADNKFAANRKRVGIFKFVDTQGNEMYKLAAYNNKNKTIKCC